MPEANYREVEAHDAKAEFNTRTEVSGNGDQFQVVEANDLEIAIFPSRIPEEKQGAKARVIANAWVTLKDENGSAYLTFQMSFRRLKKDGTLIGGGRSRTPNHKSVVSEYNKDKGQAYERMSIDGNLYRRICAIVDEVTQDE